MASIKNFFSRIFLSKGDAAPANQKNAAAQPNQKVSLFKRISTIFRDQNTVADTRTETQDSKLERHHSELMASTTETLSCTRLSLDGTCLVRSPAMHNGPKLRSSLNESIHPLVHLSRTSSFSDKNARNSELNSDHADIRRLSDKSQRASSASTRKSILSLLASRRNSEPELKREEAAFQAVNLNPKTLAHPRSSVTTNETLHSQLDIESTCLKREINYCTARELRNSLQYDSLQLPANKQ